MGHKTAEKVKQILVSGVADEVFFGGMGEPLLYNGVCDMISLASRNGMRSELITNAVMLDAETSERLVKSGINTVWISMDGFSKEEYEKYRVSSEINCSLLASLTTFSLSASGATIHYLVLKEGMAS